MAVPQMTCMHQVLGWRHLAVLARPAMERNACLIWHIYLPASCNCSRQDESNKGWGCNIIMISRTQQKPTTQLQRHVGCGAATTMRACHRRTAGASSALPPVRCARGGQASNINAHIALKYTASTNARSGWHTMAGENMRICHHRRSCQAPGRWGQIRERTQQAHTWHLGQSHHATQDITPLPPSCTHSKWMA
jgi:hypothetical protein